MDQEKLLTLMVPLIYDNTLSLSAGLEPVTYSTTWTRYRHHVPTKPLARSFCIIEMIW